MITTKEKTTDIIKAIGIGLLYAFIGFLFHLPTWLIIIIFGITTFICWPKKENEKEKRTELNNPGNFWPGFRKN